MSGANILTLSSVSKRFGAIIVADALDLTVAAGEALGIIGPNGAGKTTLFGMVSGAVRPDTGRIEFNGTDVTRLPPEKRCRMGLARSFQIPQPFTGLTVFENLLVAAAFGSGRGEREVYADCANVLERCGLAAKANLLAGSLALLDRKRLEMARALASRPRLLLLDEVAGGLTDAECASLVALIRKINAEGVTVIWIEHVVHALTAAVDRLAVLYGGKIIADGRPADVISERAVAEVYLGMPQ